MDWLRQLLFRFRGLFRRRKFEAEMAEEMRVHQEMERTARHASGASAEEAELAAQRNFGNIASIQESCRDVFGLKWIDQGMQDLRYGFRSLRKTPGFTVVAILTMALAIGAAIAIFSVVDATLLHSLPYSEPEQLVRIEDDLPGVGARDVGLSEPEWQDLEHSGIFTHVSPTWYDDNNLAGSARPSRVSLLIVAPNYFSVLGVTPQLGRTFDPLDHSPGFTTEVVISDGLWKRDFGGDPGIEGKSLRLDSDLYHVVGVMPPGYHDPGATSRDRNIEVWAATSFYGAPMADHPPRNRRNLPTAIGRLKPGLTMAAAQSQIDALVAGLRERYPEEYPPQSGWKVRLVPLKDDVVGPVRQSLLLLQGAVGIVLLIGCVNVAQLLLARASVRSREMALRQALGAGRRRLVRQLLTESVLLSVLGGVAGLGILFGVKDFLLSLVPESLPRLNDISISWTVLLFALGASVVAGVIFGLAPAWQASRQDLAPMINQEGRGSTGSREKARTLRVLVVTEFTLSLVLVIAASLLLRSFRELTDAPLGFNPHEVLTIKTRLPYPNDATSDHYSNIALQAQFYREVLRRGRALPGVREIAIGDLGAIPLGHDRSNQNPPVPLFQEGSELQGGDTPLVDSSIVTPEYFHLLEMTLIRGRLFGDFDNEKAPNVVVINEAMAHAFWPNQNPLGAHVKLSRRALSWSTVVGVVANARTESREDAGVPQVYSCLYQEGAHHLAIFLQGNLNPAAIPEAVREQVQAIDATLPVFGAEMLDETVSASLAARRFAMKLVTLFGLAALLLAALGIYGVISYGVNARTHEFGIRLALGAQRRDILWMVMRQGLNLTLTGVAIGLVVGVLVSHLMTGFLFGVNPAAPMIFAEAAALLVIVGLLACYLPARRALKVDPMIALRHE